MAENYVLHPNRAADPLPAELRTDALVCSPSHLADATGAQTGSVEHEGGRNRLGLRKCEANPEVGDVVDQASERGVFIDCYRSHAVGPLSFNCSALNHTYGSCEVNRTPLLHASVKDVRAKYIKYDATVDWPWSHFSNQPSYNHSSEGTFQ